MPLRIGFDMDGVLADFAAAYHDVEAGPLRARGPDPPGQSRERDVEGPAARRGRSEETRARTRQRRRDAVWQGIRATPDFWTTLQPTEPARSAASTR